MPGSPEDKECAGELTAALLHRGIARSAVQEATLSAIRTARLQGVTLCEFVGDPEEFAERYPREHRMPSGSAAIIVTNLITVLVVVVSIMAAMVPVGGVRLSGWEATGGVVLGLLVSVAGLVYAGVANRRLSQEVRDELARGRA